MSNLIDYLEKVKELTFDQEPLNILDKVCINEIGYLTYEKWLSASDLQKTINLHDYADGKDLRSISGFIWLRDVRKCSVSQVKVSLDVYFFPVM